MFESFDYNQDGIIDAAELSSALNHYKSVLFLLKGLRSISENSSPQACKSARSSLIS